MREIKFRAWDKQYKQMVPVGRIDFINKEIDFIENFNEPKGWDHFEIMQYTGLKDKNGVEIYEGDVVSYYDSTTMWLTSKVIDVGGAFAIETLENPILLNDFTGQYIYDGHNIDELEIMGNIYSNPELFDGK